MAENRSSETLRLTLGVGLVSLAICSRLWPHPPNFTAVGAVGLFAGGCLRQHQAWLVPPAALLFTDLLIGFYHPVTMFCVYAGCLLNVLIGRLLLSRRRTSMRLVSSSLVGAAGFFLISNFGVWLSGELYPRSSAGLWQCYLAAVPFFGWTLLGNLFYLFLLVAAWEGTLLWHSRFLHDMGRSS